MGQASLRAARIHRIEHPVRPDNEHSPLRGDRLSPAKICPVCGKEYELGDRFCPTDGAGLRSPDSAGDLVGQVIAERYHVIRKLGEGGMGQVYLAEHVRMGRKSAVKVMNPGLSRDADAIARFNREASNASRISHPNVASIYDFGETPDGMIYLAMEYIDGEPLTALIEQQGALHPARAAAIVRQTGDALAAAHDLGIVHRDLKPDNIMVARTRDGADLVKVVDFGIAKAAGAEAAQNVTRTGLVVGTPEYMSPEQLAGDPLDGRSDIYSLALVAFTALAGRLPFPSETSQESMIMRLTERPRSLAEMRPGTRWPDAVQRVMDRALQRDAKARYSSAAEMARDLEAALLAMPESSASAAGTQPMAAHAVPPTRIAAADAPTAVLAASSPTRPMAPRRRGWLMPAVAAAGMVAVLSAAGAAFTMSRDESVESSVPATASADSANSAASTSVVPEIPEPPTSAPDDGTDLLRNPAVTPVSAETAGRRRGGPARDREVRPKAVTNRLRAARGVIETNMQAETVDATELRRTITVLTRTLPEITTFADSVDARYLRAQALGLIGETERSCRELESLGSLELERQLRTEIGALRASACQ